MSYSGVPALGHDVPGDLAHGHISRPALQKLVPQALVQNISGSASQDYAFQPPLTTGTRGPHRGSTSSGGDTEAGGAVTEPQAVPPKPTAVTPLLKTAHGFSFFVASEELNLLFMAALTAASATPYPDKSCADGGVTLKVPGPDGAVRAKVACGPEFFVGLSQEPIAGANSESAIKWVHRAEQAGLGVISVQRVPESSGIAGAAPFCQGDERGACLVGALVATKSAEVAARLTNPEGFSSQAQTEGALVKQHSLVLSEPSGGWLSPDQVNEYGLAKSDEKSGVSVPLLIGGAVLGVGLIAVAVKMTKRT